VLQEKVWKSAGTDVEAAIVATRAEWEKAHKAEIVIGASSMSLITYRQSRYGRWDGHG